MAVTPFIKPIKTDKGIFYSFQSSVEDISSTIGHGEKKFRFSYFTLLNIPELKIPSMDLEENSIYLDAPGETPIMLQGYPDSGDYNMSLAESFQDYCLNMESIIISGDNYKESLYRNVSERVFWKWMKEMGAMKFRDANTINEADATTLGDSPRWVESDITSSYNRVVKYVGEIGAVNSVKRGNIYTEVYIHVPTNVGNTPVVLFDSVSDENYGPNMRYTNYPEDPADRECLIGRHYSDVNPNGPMNLSFYDVDDGAVVIEVSDSILTPVWRTINLFNDLTPNSYYTEPSLTGDDRYHTSGAQRVRKSYVGPGFSKTIEVIRPTLDGISLDFTLSNYKLVNQYPEIGSFTKFAEVAGNQSRNFEFNAILIYYDVWDEPAEPTTTPVITTNLYGILFLGKADPTTFESDWKIPTFKKFKPDVINKTNGNAFAHKLNIKMDGYVDDAAVEKSVNDYNTWSMDLYLDALTAMTKMADSYAQNLTYISELETEMQGLRDLMINDTNAEEMNARITTMEQSLAGAQTLLDNSSTFMSYINELYKKYNDILSNTTSVQVSYVLDPTAINKLLVKNQEFNLADSPVKDLSVYGSNILLLGEYSNYYKHQKTNLDPMTVTSDFSVYIDDTKVKWQKGQAFELIIGSEILLDIYDFKIYTGKDTNSVYQTLLAVYDKTDFETSGNMPAIRIICQDPITMTFIVDKIR